MTQDQDIFDTTYAAIAVSTTGLKPESDRVVEVAVAAVGREWRKPRLVFETLVRADHPYLGDAAHGLSREDLENSPLFEEVAEGLLAVLANRIAVVHNPVETIDFLESEWRRLGTSFAVPHLATMKLDRKFGSERQARGSVSSVAMANGVPCPDMSASSRALATAGIMRKVLIAAKKAKLRTVRDLVDRLGDPMPSFVASLAHPPRRTQAALIPEKLVSRPERLRNSGSPRARYLGELLVALADLKLDPDELETIKRVRDDVDLADEEIRAIHAAVFAAALERYNDDRTIDRTESNNLKRLADMLTQLG